MEYDGVKRFSEGLAVAFKDGVFGYIDKTGKLPFDTPFDFISPFKEGLASIRVESKYGFIDKKGEIAIPIIYEDAYIFAKDLQL